MKRVITVMISIHGKDLFGTPTLQYTNVIDVVEPAILRQIVVASEFAISDFLEMNTERLKG
jgi:hypothetical protein